MQPFLLTFSFSQTQFRPLTHDETNAIKQISDMMHLDKVYNTSFLDYPEAAADFIKALSPTQEYTHIVEQYIKDHYSSTIASIPYLTTLTPNLLCGVQMGQKIDLMDEFVAKIHSLSQFQRYDFDQKVMTAGNFQKEAALDAFIKNKFNVQQTIEELQKQF